MDTDKKVVVKPASDIYFSDTRPSVLNDKPHRVHFPCSAPGLNPACMHDVSPVDLNPVLYFLCFLCSCKQTQKARRIGGTSKKSEDANYDCGRKDICDDLIG